MRHEARCRGGGRWLQRECGYHGARRRCEGRERLCRYGARPPFSLERLSLLPDGRVAYRLRRPRRNGATHLVMTARLLRRVYLEDVLACPCGGRRRVIADLHDPEVVTAILVHLGLPTEGPAVARARDPTGCEAA
ncbi:transposase [Sorangium sp. So ce1014]|uniref:transposase n=1 Tax=Sorangium sp. So ce1014 TaxID=3133326 RepID=UPI003F5DFE6B